MIPNKKQRQLEYKKLKVEKLESKIREIKFKIILSRGVIEKTGIKPEHLKKFRREIAKIKTELNQRKRTNKTCF